MKEIFADICSVIIVNGGRSEFLKGHLSEIDSPDSPFKLLKNWIEGAQKMEVDEYSAMVLSTNSSAGVLLPELCTKRFSSGRVGLLYQLQ